MSPYVYDAKYHKDVYVPTIYNKFVEKQVEITRNTTLTSANIIDDGSYYIGQGKVLTINGPFQAPLKQVFYGPGSVVFAAGSVDNIFVEWWGTDVAAFQAAVNSLVYGGTVKLLPRTYTLASATLAALSDGAITINYSGITIKGVYGQTKIVLSGTSNCGIFYSSACNFLTFDRIIFTGNNVATADSAQGSAVYVINTSDTDYSDFRITNCEFSNFKGAGWVRFALGGDGDLSRVYILNNRFYGGSDRDPTDGAVAAAQIYLATSSGTGRIVYAWIEDNDLDANYVKWGISLLNTSGAAGDSIWVSRNKVINAGMDQGSGVIHAYGITVYGAFYRTFLTDNLVYNCYTCGVYAADVIGLSIKNNYIYGQVETDRTTLPVAGIAVNTGRNVTISGNTLDTCATGIEVHPMASVANANLKVNGNIVDTCPIGILVRHQTGNSRGISVNDNTVTGSTTTGIQIGYGTGATNILFDISVSINTILGCTTGIGTYNGGYLEGLTIALNLISGGTNGIVTYQHCDSPSIKNNQIKDMTTLGLYCDTNLMASITGNTFRDITNGSTAKAMDLRSTQGDLWGNVFLGTVDVIAPDNGSGVEDLGVNTPTWTSKSGTKVQNLAVGADGSPGWIYVDTVGWGTMAATTNP